MTKPSRTRITNVGDMPALTLFTIMEMGSRNSEGSPPFMWVSFDAKTLEENKGLHARTLCKVVAIRPEQHTRGPEYTLYILEPLAKVAATMVVNLTAVRINLPLRNPRYEVKVGAYDHSRIAVKVHAHTIRHNGVSRYVSAEL